MSNIEQRAEIFDSYFNNMQSVKTAVAHMDGNLKIDYSEETRQINMAKLEQLAMIDTLNDVPERDRFMARLALNDTVYTEGDVSLQRRVFRDGLAVLDRVYSAFEDGSPVVASVEKEGVTLYPSAGVGDVHITDERHVPGVLENRERQLSVKYQNGIRVVANTMFDDMIQTGRNSDDVAIIGSLPSKDSVSSDNPFYQLRKWDPAHPEYNPPYIRLGTPEQPKDMSKRIVTDSQRFAFRTASKLIGHSDWLTVERPSDAFREKLIKEFAYAYWDLLAFGEPFDEQTQRIMHIGKGKIGIEHRRNRKKSLVDYTKHEQEAIHHGADIQFDQMVDATSEIIERKERKADTMRKEYRVMRAKRDFKAFFFGTNE